MVQKLHTFWKRFVRTHIIEASTDTWTDDQINEMKKEYDASIKIISKNNLTL
jgi:hypothetical protein